MRLIRKYHFNSAWYGLTELDDSSRVELKIRQSDEPSNQVFLNLAETYQTAIAPTPRTLKAVTYPLFTINGQDLHQVTISAFIAYLNNHSELHQMRLSEYLLVDSDSCNRQLQLLDESEKTEVFNQTLGQFLGVLVALKDANPSIGSNKVATQIKAEVDNQ